MASGTQDPKPSVESEKQLPTASQESEIRILLFALDDFENREWIIKYSDSPCQLARTIQALDFMSAAFNLGDEINMSRGHDGRIEDSDNTVSTREKKKFEDIGNLQIMRQIDRAVSAGDRENMLKGTSLEGVDDVKIIHTKDGYFGMVQIGGFPQKRHGEVAQEKENEEAGKEKEQEEKATQTEYDQLILNSGSNAEDDDDLGSARARDTNQRIGSLDTRVGQTKRSKGKGRLVSDMKSGVAAGIDSDGFALAGLFGLMFVLGILVGMQLSWR